MKWFSLPGRIGTVLLAAGLALTLTSMIPAKSTGRSGREGSIMSEEYVVIRTPLTTFSPWLGLRVLVASEVDMNVYLFDVSLQELIDLIPDLNETHLWRGNNVSVLEDFLQSNPEHILFQGIVARGEPVILFPAEVTNVTLVVANSSPNRVTVRVSLETMTTLVPLERAVMISGTLFVFGIPLTISWAFQVDRSIASR